MSLTDFIKSHPIEMKIAVTLLLMAFTAFGTRKLSNALHPKFTDVEQFYRLKKRITYGGFSIALLMVVLLWAGDFYFFSTYFGLLSAGLAIALKDLIVNIAAWAFIQLRKPFVVGDRIEIGGVAGDVVDQRLFQFTLLEIGNWVDCDQSTGRVVHIPNQQVFTNPLANYTKGFQYIWNEIGVLITFESDWVHAKQILMQIAELHTAHFTNDAQNQIRDAAKKFMIYYNNLTPTVYTSVQSDGVLLTIRYLCAPKNRRITQEQIWEDVLHTFSNCDDIHLAYRTVRVVD